MQPEDEGEYVYTAGEAQSAANLYVEVAYIIPKCFQDTVIAESQTANFECEVTKPNLETHWFRDGIEIDVSDDKYEIIVEGLSYKLLIHNCTVNDNCEIVFLAADESVAANLEVRPIDIVEDCQDVVQPEGKDATFCCVTSAGAVPTWSKDNVRLRKKLNKFVTRQEGCRNYLTVKNVCMEDAGSYICQIGAAESSAVLYVEVAQIQFVSETAISVAAVVSEKVAQVEFQINKEGVEGQWFHNGLKVNVQAAKYNYVVDRTFHKLMIKELTVGDSGEYTFSVGNQKATASLKVEAVSSKPSFTREMSIAEAELAGDAMFSCEVQGTPTPVVSFYKKGNQIQENQKYNLNQTGNKYMLHVRCCTEADVSQYTCTAKNAAGSAMSSAELKIVQDKPWDEQQQQSRQNSKHDTINLTFHTTLSKTTQFKQSIV